MSFLNPVNEPVLRFSSTDAGAPQINYNTRVAGDVKAVLKSCLVTGYGSKASAGWSIVNEVDHVAEFVSPSTAMSDYRLGIDDTSATNTIWYYLHQGVKVIPVNNEHKKAFNSIDKLNASNGWQLLVTERGIYFIEMLYNVGVNDRLARVTYWGQVKSALTDANAKNIAYWCVGYGEAQNAPYQFFGAATKNHYHLGAYTALRFTATNLPFLSVTARVYGLSTVDITDALYLYTSDCFAGQHPGILLKHVNNISNLYGVKDEVFDGRPVLSVCIGYENGSATVAADYSRSILLYLDTWGY